MKKKFSVITPYIPLLVVVIAFVIVIFYNKNKAFGLSNEAINEEKQLSAEETVRLYFYYSNRRDNSADNLLDDRLFYGGSLLSSVSLFEDIKLIYLEELSTEKSPNEREVYEIKTFQVKFNCSFFIASGKESENTIDISFELIKQESDSPWKIISMGNG